MDFLEPILTYLQKKFYATKDFTYKNLKNNIKTDKLVILPRDKDLCVVIMQ